MLVIGVFVTGKKKLLYAGGGIGGSKNFLEGVTLGTRASEASEH